MIGPVDWAIVGFRIWLIDWLVHYLVGLSLPGPAGWRVWAKAHGTHNAPFFLAGEVLPPRLGKENIWDLLDVGIGGELMLGCSNVHNTGEFPSFLMSHLMLLIGIPLRLHVFIKGL